MSVDFNTIVAVPERDLIHLSAMLDFRRTVAARMAQVDVKHQNYGAYIAHRDEYLMADELLKLSMFDGYRDECTEELPPYKDNGNTFADTPFFDDATLDYLYSDGSTIDDTVDVPF